MILLLILLILNVGLLVSFVVLAIENVKLNNKVDKEIKNISDGYLQVKKQVDKMIEFPKGKETDKKTAP